MVSLNKIYTRTGDEGQTSIGDGSRVSKLDPRIVAGGSVDEANCMIGMAAAECDDEAFRAPLFRIQQRLFDLGADLTCPWNPDATEDHCPRIQQEQIQWLEDQIDAATDQLQPLKSFILPGGCRLAATLHLARAVCRRAEIDVLAFQQTTKINPLVAVFLNRLSDYLFVAARLANNKGIDDVLWKPASPD